MWMLRTLSHEVPAAVSAVPVGEITGLQILSYNHSNNLNEPYPILAGRGPLHQLLKQATRFQRLPLTLSYGDLTPFTEVM